MLNWQKCANIDVYDLLKTAGFEGTMFIDPKKIADEMDIPVSYKYDIEKIAAGLDGNVTYTNGKLNVWINPTVSETRQKFTLAHEIAHVVNDIAPNITEDFEDSVGNFAFNRDGAKKEEEYKANDFAARLLMPKTLVENAAKEVFDNNAKTQKSTYADELAEILSEKFGVSKRAMTIRLIRLGYIKG